MREGSDNLKKPKLVTIRQRANREDTRAYFSHSSAAAE